MKSHADHPARGSLRRRIALWLLPPLAVLLGINALLSYRSALEGVNRAYDSALTASIRAVAERVHSLDGEIQLDIPYAAFEDAAQERIYHAVIDAAGRVLTGYDDLLPPQELPEVGEVRIVDAAYRGYAVRLAAMRKRLYDPAVPVDDWVTILFAETTDSRNALARDLFLDSMRLQLALILVGGIVMVLALDSAFRPLLELRDTMRRRDAEDLMPVAADKVPSEVAPLIDAINHHMERLSTMLVARRRFLADAAHQIRTPLAVLGTQAEYGLQLSDPEEMLDTFASLHRSIRSARRLVNQMLTMSRAESDDGFIGERTTVDLDALVKDVAMDLVPLALTKGIDLAFEGLGRAVPIEGNGPMLREMVANLLDNAIRYSPAESQVTLALAAFDGQAMISVCDQGPGIPEAERENVFHRFYRILGQGDSEGSGLGLSIVREISDAHGGRVSMKDGPGGRGLCVEVELACKPAMPADTGR